MKFPKREDRWLERRNRGETVMGFYGSLERAFLYCERQRTVAVFLKRLMDLTLALVALVVLAPLLGLVAFLIRLGSPGPVFYISERIGKWGYPFSCLKFRTMVLDADVQREKFADMNERDLVLFKLSNDPRVTRLGKFLRKYSIDELPQLLNILRGEMSLVGPRPPLAKEVEMYETEHLVRLAVLPGLTGLWQVESRNNPSFANYIALDTQYVEKWTLWLDMTILYRTVGAVIRGTGS
jgi:lipopolysaccharide/colanic/teichoic acid biosynthesis glycosyltransferase